MINQPQPNLQSSRRHFLTADSNYMATVEIKTYGAETQAFWWVSGPNSEGSPVLLGQLSVSLPAYSQERLQTMFLNYVLPLIKESNSLDGIPVRVFDRNQIEVEQVLTKHFDFHADAMSVAGHSVIQQAATAYRLVDSFGLQKVIEFLAHKQGVEVNTLKKRVSLARQAQLLSRKRESRTGAY